MEHVGTLAMNRF